MITKYIENSGNQLLASGNGKVTVDQTNGEIIVRNGQHIVTQIDDDGFKYYDNNNILRISIGQNANGQEQIIVYGTDGKAQILVGQDPSDGEPILAISEDGRDVIQDLA